MIFYVLKDGERIYTLEIPHDSGPVHLPDLANIGVTGFPSSHPDISIRGNDILFGFENAKRRGISSHQECPAAVMIANAMICMIKTWHARA